MRVLVLFAHPVETSYGAALHATAIEALTAAGHEVDDCDLYAERFNPVFSRAEQVAYLDVTARGKDVQAYVDRLLAADALVLVFPVWNFGYPAILKGFLDRVFLPGVSFELRRGKAHPILHNIHRVAAVSTYGATRTRAILVGDPPRRAITRVMRAIVNPLARTRYLALYDMDRIGAGARDAFRERVARELRAF